MRPRTRLETMKLGKDPVMKAIIGALWRPPVDLSKLDPFTITPEKVTIDRDVHVVGNFTASKEVAGWIAGAVSSDVLAGLYAAAPLYKPTASSIGLAYNTNQFEVNGFNELQIKAGVLVPSSHSHAIADVTGLQGALDGKLSYRTFGTAANYDISQLSSLANTLNGSDGRTANDLNNHFTFSYGQNTPYWGMVASWESLGVKMQINSHWNYGNNLAFRTYSPDRGVWNAWREIWHNGNLPSPLQGSGTPGYLSVFTGDGKSLGDSGVYHSAGNTTIGGTTTPYKLTISNNNNLGLEFDPLGLQFSQGFGMQVYDRTSGQYKPLQIYASKIVLDGGNVGIGYTTGYPIDYYRFSVNGSMYVDSNIITNGILNLNRALLGANSYHSLNRDALTTENMFVWRTADISKWYLGQRSKNSEDGFSLYSTSIGDDILYFSPNGSIDLSNILRLTGNTNSSAKINSINKFLAINDVSDYPVGIGYNSDSVLYGGYKLHVNGNTFVNGTVVSGNNKGFQNATYYADQINPIWSFGNAPNYGIAYNQKNIPPYDDIRFHFGDKNNPQFKVEMNGDTYTTGKFHAPSAKLQTIELKNASGATIWILELSGTDLVFKNSAWVKKMKADQNGNIFSAGEVTAHSLQI